MMLSSFFWILGIASGNACSEYERGLLRAASVWNRWTPLPRHVRRTGRREDARRDRRLRPGTRTHVLRTRSACPACAIGRVRWRNPVGRQTGAIRGTSGGMPAVNATTRHPSACARQGLRVGTYAWLLSLLPSLSMIGLHSTSRPTGGSCVNPPVDSHLKQLDLPRQFPRLL